MAGIAVVAAAAGWVASSRIESPQQRAADAAAPPASVITAPVERRAIDSTLVTRGTVAATRQVTVQPTPQSSGSSLITAIDVKPGAKVRQGEVLLEVSGRPVFAIGGSIPVYRDLHPGLKGKDVAQLQQALKALGFSSPTDGSYGAATASAVSAWYQQAGFEPAPTGPDDQDLLDAAQQTVLGAKRALVDARTADDPAPRSIERAKQDLATAQQKLAQVQATTGPAVPAAELVALPTLPAEVRAVNMEVGDTTGNASLTLSSGDLSVAATLSPEMAGLIHKGQKVELDAEGLGKNATGTVTAIDTSSGSDQGTSSAPQQDGGDQGDQSGQGDQSSQGGQDAPSGPTFTVTPTKPLGSAWDGQDVRVTVVSAQSKGPVLVVPVSAVFADTGERTRVVVREKDGSQRQVEVRTGVSGDGYIAVSPVGSGKLAKGDHVVVGTAGAKR